MDVRQVESLFNLSGLTTSQIKPIPNGYWPKTEAYREISEKNPWWEVTCELGTIVVGWRKRVILINWINTNRRGLVTMDQVTKTDTMVHAWSLSDAVKYLSVVTSLPSVVGPRLATREIVETNRDTIVEILGSIRLRMVAKSDTDIARKNVITLLTAMPKETPMTLTVTDPYRGPDERSIMCSLTIGKMTVTFH